jgi:WD40 repeat protein
MLAWFYADPDTSFQLAFIGDDYILRTFNVSELSWTDLANPIKMDSDVVFILPGSNFLTIRFVTDQGPGLAMFRQDTDGWVFEAGDALPEIINWRGASTPDGLGIAFTTISSNDRYAIEVRSPQFPDGEIIAELDYELQTETAPVVSVAWSPDQQNIAAGTRDGLLTVWEINSKIRVFQVPLFEGTIHSVAWSPSASTIAVAGSDGDENGGQQFIRLLNAVSGGLIRELPLDFGRTAQTLAFSPDGSLLVSGDSAGSVQIWDVETGERLADLRGHTLAITGVAFAPDGMSFATASRDGTVRVWGIR